MYYKSAVVVESNMTDAVYININKQKSHTQCDIRITVILTDAGTWPMSSVEAAIVYDISARLIGYTIDFV